MSTLTPLQVTYLNTVMQSLQAAPQGSKAGIVADAAAHLGVSSGTVSRWLKDHMGRSTGRKRRTDAGLRGVARPELLKISAALLGSLRKTGNRIMTFDDAVEMLRYAGEIDTDLSASRIAVILREQGLHPEQLTRPSPSIEQRSLHPNHVWQFDASVCVAYYLSNAQGLCVMDEKKFYKNKPGNISRIMADRLIRYTAADHNTHDLLTRYYLGSECALSLTDFMIWCFAPKSHHIMHGVPFIVQMDMGSANTSATAINLLERLKVRHIVHERHNSRANGSVEKAHHLVENHFESFLKLQHVVDLDDLNLKAELWANHFGATQMHSRYQDTRHNCWMRIQVDQLRLAPPVELMRELATTHPKNRTVSNDLEITFKVNGHGALRFDVRYVPGVRAGMKLPVVVNAFSMPSVEVGHADQDTGEICWMTIDPLAIGEDGWREDAPVIGEELRAAHRGLLEHNRDEVMVTAFGGADAEEAAKRQENNGLLFEGRVNPFERIAEAELPAYLPRRGTDLDAQARVVEVKRLTHVEAAMRLKAALRDHYTPEVFKWLQTRFEDGVPEDQIDGIAAQFMPAQTGPEPVVADQVSNGAPVLRIVGGSGQ
jgi:hypothetical protein